MEKTLSAKYDSEGNKQEIYSSIADIVKHRKIVADAKTLFLNLDHQSRGSMTYPEEQRPVVVK